MYTIKYENSDPKCHLSLSNLITKNCFGPRKPVNGNSMVVTWYILDYSGPVCNISKKSIKICSIAMNRKVHNHDKRFIKKIEQIIVLNKYF